MITFNVPDMSCGHCVATITKTIRALDAEATVNTDLASHTVSVDAKSTPEALAQALDEAGYPATVKASS